jgi:hypothetical protein
MSVSDVVQFIDAIALPWQAEQAHAIRESIFAAVPEATERLQYKKPHFLVNGKYLAVITPSKAALSLTIFNASHLDPPEAFFEAGGPPERKTAKFKEGDTVDTDVVTRLVAVAASGLG